VVEVTWLVTYRNDQRRLWPKLEQAIRFPPERPAARISFGVDGAASK
jgi:hypothetical protein